MERNKFDDILDMFPDEKILAADGYDDCVIGYDFGIGDIRLIYSVKLILDKLVLVEGLDEIDAIEHFEYNMRGGYVGEQTPIWCQDDF